MLLEGRMLSIVQEESQSCCSTALLLALRSFASVDMQWIAWPSRLTIEKGSHVRSRDLLWRLLGISVILNPRVDRELWSPRYSQIKGFRPAKRVHLKLHPLKFYVTPRTKILAVPAVARTDTSATFGLAWSLKKSWQYKKPILSHPFNSFFLFSSHQFGRTSPSCEFLLNGGSAKAACWESDLSISGFPFPASYSNVIALPNQPWTSSEVLDCGVISTCHRIPKSSIS